MVAQGKAKPGMLLRVMKDGDETNGAAQRDEDGPTTKERHEGKEKEKIHSRNSDSDNSDTETVPNKSSDSYDGDGNSTSANKNASGQTEPSATSEGNKEVVAVLPRGHRNAHRHTSGERPKKQRQDILGPAVAARGLWLEKVWYENDWCLNPDALALDFTPFVDCSFSTQV